MSDRELLELAARAAGVEAYWDEEYQRMQMDYMHKGGTNYEEWNPLTDDGDALRLAIHCDIHIKSIASTKHSSAGYAVNEIRMDYICEPHETDPYAATRRAIVRAAAAIGEPKK